MQIGPSNLTQKKRNKTGAVAPSARFHRMGNTRVIVSALQLQSADQKMYVRLAEQRLDLTDA